MAKIWLQCAFSALFTAFCFYNSAFKASLPESVILGGLAFTNTMLISLYSDYRKNNKKDDPA